MDTILLYWLTLIYFKDDKHPFLIPASITFFTSIIWAVYSAWHDSILKG